MLGIGPSRMLDDIELGIENSVELDKRGRPEKMLGIEMSWHKNRTEVTLTQRALIESMAKSHLPQQTIERSIPGRVSSLPLDPKLYQEDKDNNVDQKRFQAIVGGLLFISRMTRPEIAIHVNLLGRRASKPSPQNHQAALRVLAYLHSSKNEGIILRKPENLLVKVYADASYGGEKARSQSGVIVTLGKQAIGWYSRRQDVVSLSITEAEYIAGCEGAKDCAWTRQFLQELGMEQATVPTLITDSEGALNLSQTNKYLRRTRHIDHRYHYLRQQTKQDLLKLDHIPGKDNPADIVTKLLPMSTITKWKESWMAGKNTLEGNSS